MYIPNMQATTSFVLPSLVKMLCQYTGAQAAEVLQTDFTIYLHQRVMFNLVDGPRLYVVFVNLGDQVTSNGCATMIARDRGGYKIVVADVTPSTSSKPEFTLTMLRDLFDSVEYSQEAADEMTRLNDWSASNEGFPIHIGSVNNKLTFRVDLLFKSEHTHVGGKPYKVIMFSVAHSPDPKDNGVYTAMFPVFKDSNSGFQLTTVSQLWSRVIGMYRAGDYDAFLDAVHAAAEEKLIEGFNHHVLDPEQDYVICFTQPKVNDVHDAGFKPMFPYCVHGMRVHDHHYVNQEQEPCVSKVSLYTVVNDYGEIVERKASHFIKVI